MGVTEYWYVASSVSGSWMISATADVTRAPFVIALGDGREKIDPEACLHKGSLANACDYMLHCVALHRSSYVPNEMFLQVF